MILVLVSDFGMGKTTVAAGAFYLFPKGARRYILREGMDAVQGLVRSEEVAMIDACEPTGKQWDQTKGIINNAMQSGGICIIDPATDLSDIISGAVSYEMYKAGRRTSYGEADKETRKQIAALFGAMAQSRCQFIMLMHCTVQEQPSATEVNRVYRPAAYDAKRMDRILLQMAGHVVAIVEDEDEKGKMIRLALTQNNKVWGGLKTRNRTCPGSFTIPYSYKTPHDSVNIFVRHGLIIPPEAKTETKDGDKKPESAE